jgi:hypothetical protein
MTQYIRHGLCSLFAQRFREEKEALTKFLEEVSDRRSNVEIMLVRQEQRYIV